MAVKVAINALGRIGRLTFRQMFGQEGFEIVAINDKYPADMIAHLLKYDSTQGKYNRDVKGDVENNCLIVEGKKIPIFHETDAVNIPWGKYDVDVVLDCTGAYKTQKKAMAHIQAGAKKVVISAPADNETPTVVFGVNHNILKAEDKIISAASCTTNCLAPMVKRLNELCPVQNGIMTTIHAYTGDQKLLDASHKKSDFRRARSAALSIVPNTTGAAKAIGLVIPELKGKLIGAAQRVPVPTGSSTILTAVVKGKVTVDEINAYMKKTADETFGYTEEELVSTDIIGTEFGGLFDATQTMVNPINDDLTQVQVVAWYDNENGYTAQMCRTIKYFATL